MRNGCMVIRWETVVMVEYSENAYLWYAIPDYSKLDKYQKPHLNIVAPAQCRVNVKIVQRAVKPPPVNVAYCWDNKTGCKPQKHRATEKERSVKR